MHTKLPWKARIPLSDLPLHLQFSEILLSISNNFDFQWLPKLPIFYIIDIIFLFRQVAEDILHLNLFNASLAMPVTFKSLVF